MKSLLYLGHAERQLWIRDRQGWKQRDGEPDGPVWIVTDLVDESFAETTIPRVFGRDRAAIITRQLQNSFSGTPYCQALLPFRGSKKPTSWLDRIVPTRLTLTGVSGTRLDAELDTLSAPVAGIWTTSLLLALLGQDHHLPDDLFIALPEPNALRIVFLKDRIPMLTRLVPVSGKPETYVDEIIRTQRYVENLKLLKRGDSAHPILLLGDTHSFHAPLSANGLRLVDAPFLKTDKPPADWRFPIFDLAMRSPPGQLAPTTRRAGFLGKRLHQAALLTSAMLLLLTAGSITTNLVSFFEARHANNEALTMSGQVDRQLSEIDQQITHIGIPPQLIHDAMDLSEHELKSAPVFPDYLRHLSQAVSKRDDIRLTHITWRLLNPRETACPKTALTSQPAPATLTDPADQPARHTIELSFALALPDQLRPLDKRDTLKQVAADLTTMPNSTLLENPAQISASGMLQGGTKSSSSQPVTWCMILTRSTEDLVTP